MQIAHLFCCIFESKTSKRKAIIKKHTNRVIGVTLLDGFHIGDLVPIWSCAGQHRNLSVLKITCRKNVTRDKTMHFITLV